MPYMKQGEKFGRLTVLCDVNKSYDKSLFQCDCGKIKELIPNYVRNSTRSCGCLRNERVSRARKTHGLTETILYSRWQSMKNRCYNHSVDNYERYGGRGIKVCDEWRNSFESFRDWSLNNGYDEKLTIDRIDFNGNYCPENCRWIPAFDQASNSRKCRFLEAFGEKKHLMAWFRDERCQVKLVTLRRRLKRGMSLQEALTK